MCCSAKILLCTYMYTTNVYYCTHWHTYSDYLPRKGDDYYADCGFIEINYLGKLIQTLI